MSLIANTVHSQPILIDKNLLNPQLYSQSINTFLSYFDIQIKKPDLAFLSEILFHYSKLPYENLSKIIKHQNQAEWQNKIRLPEEVMEDHASFRLGGTCFALTFTLETILSQLGYTCYPVLADMKWKPNSHSALIVLYEGGKYLVDPGYLLNQPMRLDTEQPRVFTSEVSGVFVTFRSPETGYDLYTYNKEKTKWRYRFNDIVCNKQTFLEYWLDSFYWNSMHGILLNKVEQGRMVYVHKTFMRETTFEGKKNRNIKKDFHAAIEEVFGIHPKIVEEALAALEVNMTRERESGLWVPKESRVKN